MISTLCAFSTLRTTAQMRNALWMKLHGSLDQPTGSTRARRRIPLDWSNSERSLANTLDPFHEIEIFKNPGPLMSDIDTMCTVNLAEYWYCAQESCSLDDVDALVVNRLEQQSQSLLGRLEGIQSLSILLRTQCRISLRHHEVDPLIQSIQSFLSLEKDMKNLSW
jgi:hypothetical protein